MSITNSEITDSQYVALVRGYELIKRYFYPRMNSEQWNMLKKKVEQMKNTSNKAVTTIDIDQLLEVTLEKYRLLLANVMPHVKEIFHGCDVIFSLNT